MGARPGNRWPWWAALALALGCSSSEDGEPLQVVNDAGNRCAGGACRDAGALDASMTTPIAGSGGAIGMPMAGTPPTTQPPPKVPICTPQVPLVPVCAGCVCVAFPDCADAVTECDESCWALLSCGYDRCLTTLEYECLERECPTHLDAIERTLAVSNCTAQCYGSCLNDIRRLGMDEMDAGL